MQRPTKIKRGDTRPRRFVCKDADGPADLTNATSAKFLMDKDPGYELTFTPVNAAASFDPDRLSGIVVWPPSAGAVGTVGHFWAEVQVTYGDGTTQTFPEDGWLPVEVVQDLGD